MLEFVYSGLYFVQDENDFINPLLQVGSGSSENSTGSGSSSLLYFMHNLHMSYFMNWGFPDDCAC